MPFDDLKTLPKPEDWPPHIRPREAGVEPTMQPVAWAVESCRGIEGIYCLQSIACDRATHWGEGGRVFPLYAAPVAVPSVERHDAATCCGERQEPDVGEGWRELRPDEILQQGDEAYVGHDQPQWVPTFCVGQRVADVGNGYRRRVTPEVSSIAANEPSSVTSGTLPDAEPDVGEGWREIRTGEHAEHLADGDCMQDANGFWEPIYSFSVNGFGSPHRRYRRRVAPNEKPLGAFLDEENNQLRDEKAALRSEVERLRLRPIEITPAAISAMCQRNQREALRKSIENLKAENHEQQKKILQACLENERLRSEVERLRLRPEEMDALSWCRDVMPKMGEPCAVVQIHSDVCGKMLKRLGGGV
jgi:hypothetical protein